MGYDFPQLDFEESDTAFNNHPRIRPKIRFETKDNHTQYKCAWDVKCNTTN